MDNIITLNFYNYCNYINYNNLLKTCKYYYYDNNIINNDNIYKYYIINKFSIEFALCANLFIDSFKDCFIKIINFENKLYSMNLEPWNEELYYIFWKQQKWII